MSLPGQQHSQRSGAPHDLLSYVFFRTAVWRLVGAKLASLHLPGNHQGCTDHVGTCLKVMGTSLD